MSEEQLEYSAKLLANNISLEKRNKEIYEGFMATTEELCEATKEIERLNNKVEELMSLYTTEREVKEDYKSIIKEVREYIISNQNEELSVDSYFKYKDLVEFNDILEILDKTN